MSHTPGPWKVYAKPIERKSLVDGKELAPAIERLIGTEWEHGQLKGPSPVITKVYGVGYSYVDISEDNARLMAAAPELLDALRTVMEWIGNWDPNFTSDPAWPEDAEKVRAVIKKATGG